MKIKIISAKPGIWYQNKIGNTYESSKENDFGTGYVCDILTQCSPGRMTKEYYVLKEDCIVVGSLKLAQMSQEMSEALKKAVSTDEHMADNGYSCKGMLCEYEGFKNFYYRLWAWVKVVGNNIYIVITADEGNGYCSVVYTDMYIKEIVKEINQ